MTSAAGVLKPSAPPRVATLAVHHIHAGWYDISSSSDYRGCRGCAVVAECRSRMRCSQIGFSRFLVAQHSLNYKIDACIEGLVNMTEAEAVDTVSKGRTCRWNR